MACERAKLKCVRLECHVKLGSLTNQMNTKNLFPSRRVMIVKMNMTLLRVLCAGILKKAFEAETTGVELGVSG